MSLKTEEFKYTYTVQPSDIWQVRMYYAYTSYLSVVNIICIVASVILIVTMWKTSAGWFRVVMIIFLSLFTVVQPLFIYLTSVLQAKGSKDEIILTVNASSITVETGGKKESYGWNKVVSVTIKPTLVIIYTDLSHGYILTNRILKDTRNDFIGFIREIRR